VAGVAVTGTGIALRQWAVTTVGRFFVGHVLVQPGQTVVSVGPHRWLRHPSYAGQWLEMIGIGLGTGNVVSMATCVLLPLIGITARIAGEERELTASLPGYRDYIPGQTAAHSAHLVKPPPQALCRPAELDSQRTHAPPPRRSVTSFARPAQRRR
jgi:isoprenylcysteine carboxyl methyltransferase (ICMT) family protein